MFGRGGLTYPYPSTGTRVHVYRRSQLLWQQQQARGVRKKRVSVFINTYIYTGISSPTSTTVAELPPVTVEKRIDIAIPK